ncbi:hypothetical protein K449DRAFT_428925 [Hypoxylon sp. EC38]|nr:hypothetical protein K449DRAFT_428925 [Hypoxylon sp. EC38]
MSNVSFIESHEPHLTRVLSAEFKHVMNGAKEVGADGVLRGVEKWREINLEADFVGYAAHNLPVVVPPPRVVA